MPPGLHEARRLAQGLLAAEAGRLLERRVDVLDHAFEVRDDDRVGRLLDGAGQLVDSILCLPAVRNIARDADHHQATFDGDPVEAEFHPVPFAARRIEAAFETRRAPLQRLRERGTEQCRALGIAQKIGYGHAVQVPGELRLRHAQPFLGDAVAEQELHLVAQDENGVARAVEIGAQQLEVKPLVLQRRSDGHAA